MNERKRVADKGRSGEHGRRRTYLLSAQTLDAKTLPPGLYLVATPIGNLADMTLRGLETLAAADLIACEDTRVTRRLLGHYGITTPLCTYHDHNAATARPKILGRLAEGAAIALVSDAGTPLISDPGYKLVREAHAAGHRVTAIPGASAVLAAVASSGLPTDRFFFEGFLPAKPTARQARIAQLATVPATLVLFESGPRLTEALADLAAGLGARGATVCRELTKLHEEVRRGELATLAAAYAQGAELRGEIVIVVAPPAPAVLSVAEVDTLLRQALRDRSLKDAVSAVAEATGRARRDVYQRALVLAKNSNPPKN
jgi:16S rRNA (cytidine1402-2'-O)-methyltransferase